MSILVGKDSKVVTQGITGSTGQFHTRTCKEYGTNMVAGVTPGKGGGDFEGIPIYDTVREAREKCGKHLKGVQVPAPVGRLRVEASSAETPVGCAREYSSAGIRQPRTRSDLSAATWFTPMTPTRQTKTPTYG